MKLDRIIITWVEANESRNFIKTLKDLPEETIQGNFSMIGANYFNKSGIIILNVPCNEKESETIQFNAPKASKNAKKSSIGLEFDYNSQHYQLKKDVRISP